MFHDNVDCRFEEIVVVVVSGCNDDDDGGRAMVMVEKLLSKWLGEE